jgi:hypothetical protein
MARSTGELTFSANIVFQFADVPFEERFERARREGGPMDGIQCWVALPRENEETAPAFAHHAATQLPTFEARGARGRVIAGEAFGCRAPAHTYSPLFYVHYELGAGGRAELPRQYSERAAYIASGSVEADGRSFAEDQLLVFERGAAAVVTATTPAVLMLLGGEPLGERFIEWNFVSSSKERIEQAKSDWAAGRMKLPDLDDSEFIPLPADPGAPPNPMS